MLTLNVSNSIKFTSPTYKSCFEQLGLLWKDTSISEKKPNRLENKICVTPKEFVYQRSFIRCVISNLDWDVNIEGEGNDRVFRCANLPPTLLITILYYLNEQNWLCVIKYFNECKFLLFKYELTIKIIWNHSVYTKFPSTLGIINRDIIKFSFPWFFHENMYLFFNNTFLMIGFEKYAIEI